MTRRCPYCEQPMEDKKRRSFSLTPKRKELFELVLSHGDQGVSTTALLDIFSSDRTEKRIAGFTTLRTTIHNINKKITPLRIVGGGGYYKIESSMRSS